MTNEISRYETRSLDAFDANVGSEVEDAVRLGFKDNQYVEGRDKTSIDKGTAMRLAPTSTSDCWTLWIGGRPADVRMREWVSTQPPIHRDQLGYTDESQWLDGKDPWAYTLVMALKDANDTLFKFSTGSVGGINAIKKVLRTWRRDRDQHPGLVPVVTLDSDSYVHKTHGSTIYFPVFEIVGWETWDGSAPAAPIQAPIAEVLDDSIPF
jgi:hypothetical protein